MSMWPRVPPWRRTLESSATRAAHGGRRHDAAAVGDSDGNYHVVSAFHPWMNLSHAPNQIASNTTPKGPEKRPAVPKRISREPTSQEKSRTPCWLP